MRDCYSSYAAESMVDAALIANTSHNWDRFLGPWMDLWLATYETDLHSKSRQFQPKAVFIFDVMSFLLHKLPSFL